MQGPRLKALGVACLAALAFAGSIPGAQFVQDDFQAIVENPVVSGQLPASEAFRRDFWGRSTEQNVPSYRPVATLALRGLWRLGGGAPWVFHAANVLLHAATAAAVVVLLDGAVAAAAFFAVFAASAEAVHAAVGIADLLLALLVVLGAIAHRRGKPWWALIALFVAAGAKETALAAPIAWFLLQPARTRRGWFVAYFAALAAWLPLRAHALGALLQRGPDALYRPLYDAPAVARIFGAGRIFAERYLAGMIDPWRRVYACSAPACGPSSPRDALAWAGLIAFGLIVAGAIALRRTRTGAGLAWFAVFFLPISNFVLPGTVMYAERLLYTPAIGLAIALAAGAAALGRAGWFGFAALGLLNLVALQQRNLEWRSAESLYLSGLDAAPESAQSWNNAGIALVLRGDAAGAEKAERRALSLWPGYPEARSVLGSALELQGRNEEAEREYRAAAESRPSAEMIAPYASFLLRQGRRDEAQRAIARGLRLFPDSPRLRALEQRARQ